MKASGVYETSRSFVRFTPNSAYDGAGTFVRFDRHTGWNIPKYKYLPVARKLAGYGCHLFLAAACRTQIVYGVFVRHILVETIGPRGKVLICYGSHESEQAWLHDAIMRLVSQVFVRTVDLGC